MARKASDFSLGFGHFGNGLVVWNSKLYVNGDYENIAHIASDRSVRFYIHDLPDEVVGQIYRKAITSTATISATQNVSVFCTPPLADALIDAKFVSIWNGHGMLVETKCKVNLKTRQVVEIEQSGVDGDLNILDEERIEFASGDAYPVYQKDEAEEGDFWYE